MEKKRVIPVSLILQTGGFHGVLVIQLGSHFFPLKKEPQGISYLTDTWMSKLLPDTITFSWYCFHIQDKDLFCFWWRDVIK